MFKNYFTTILRNLLRNKLSTIINISGLAVSIACCIVIYVFIKHEKTFDHFHSRADRIYRLVFDDKTADGTAHGGYTAFPMARALRNDFPQLETVTQLYVRNYALVKIPGTGGERRMFEENEATYADEFFFNTFDFPLIAGNRKGLLTAPDEVILTRRLADRYFGTNAGNNKNSSAYEVLIGRVITVNKQNFRITAILEDVPRNSNIPFNMLLPFKFLEKSSPEMVSNWKSAYSESYTFVTFPPALSPAAFDASLVAFKNKYLDAERAKKTTYHPQRLKEVHTDEMYGGTVYATPGILILAFLIMGAVVLLTACINFINLATAQSLKRAKEIGIRKTLGSSRWQLMMRFMGETFLINVAASLIAIVLARWFLEAFNNYLAFVVDFNLHIDITVVAFLVALGIAITFLAGYYPARVLSSFQPILALKSAMKARNAGFSNRFSLRKALVVVQFVVTQLLIIGTVVVATQMNYFYSKETGYRKDGILTVDIPSADAQKLARLKTTLLSNPNINEVSFSSGPPTSASNGFADVKLPQGSATDNISIERKFIDNDYLKTFNIGLLAGRDLMASDTVYLADAVQEYNILLNQKAATRLGFITPESAIGKKVLINDRESGIIVGVTADFYNTSLQQQVGPCLLFYGRNWVSFAGIYLKNPNNVASKNFIRDTWESIYPENIYKAGTLDEYIHNKAFYIIEDIMYQGFKIFVGMAIVIGCMGLYGLVAFLAAQRQKEIGIRKVLGSSVKGILFLFSREFAWLICIAFLVAAPLGYLAMNAWLETFANKIPLSASYFVIAFLISLAIATITISFQSIKAAMANPVTSLRSE
jgi:putative ABC transport system permease protein